MAVSRVAAALAGALAALAAWRLCRYEIAEQSMAPALAPGDYVVALRSPSRLRPGDIVVFEHPERADFTLVKRVVAVDGGRVTVRGDNRAASHDVAAFPAADVEARVVLRYWPPRRAGWLTR